MTVGARVPSKAGGGGAVSEVRRTVSKGSAVVLEADDARGAGLALCPGSACGLQMSIPVTGLGGDRVALGSVISDVPEEASAWHQGSLSKDRRKDKLSPTGRCCLRELHSPSWVPA